VKAYGKLVKSNQESKQKVSFLSGFCLLFGTTNKKALRFPNKEFKALKLIYLLALKI
jgi:hypothetical protein